MWHPGRDPRRSRRIVCYRFSCQMAGSRLRGQSMRKLLVIAGALIVLAGITSAQAQIYPSKLITVIVPFAPGGQSDTIMRIMGERMRGSLGQSIVIENVTGAGGTIG